MTQKSVFITGASTGIGQATALRLDQFGFRVFAGIQPGEDTTRLRERASERLDIVPIDITNREMILDAAEHIARSVGADGLYGLHNNAGYALTGPLEFTPVESIRKQFAVNVMGHVAVTQAMLAMLRQGQGRIINTTSILGKVVLPFTGPYAMSKFAMEAFTDTLRQELAPWNIPVIAIEPGSVATPFFRKSAQSMEEVMAGFSAEAEQYYGAKLARSQELSTRMSQQAISPDEVARVVLTAFTASRPKTRYLVGREARILAFFARWLPDRRRDKAILNQYRAEE